MNNDLAASIAVFNRNNVWISDNAVTSCRNCKTEFGFLTRKHHCRNCGNIFCYACCHNWIVIPDFITDRPNPADYWNLSYYITSLKNEEERVCDQCYKLIKERTVSYQRILSIFDNPIPIDKIKELPESDADFKHHYFDHLRNIQYYLPNHKYTDIDKKMLHVNAHYFSKHSKYLVHLIKSIDWGQTESLSGSMHRSLTRKSKNNETELKFVMNIINGDKITTCNEIYCTRTCQELLSCDDCVNILYSCANYLPDELIKYLFDIILKTPEQVILCHLSFFVTLVKNTRHQLLHSLLYRLLSTSKKMIYHTYWFLTNAREDANINQLTNINNFINLFDAKLVKTMHHEYMFYVGLINHLHNLEEYLLNTFERYKPISLPYEPDLQLTDVDLTSINKGTSHTEPVSVTFVATETMDGTNPIYHKIRLLFKKESILNDVLVLNLMTLSDIILSEHLSTNFGVVVYPAMPLTANSGMIEMIENAETVYAINTRKTTILQHIIERNENRIVGDVLDRYMFSLVSYTLHSYFIGLGDRHLQNIMITDDGAIFHIDFGFILGEDAYPLTASDIKLNSGMLDVIGGNEGHRYQKYLNLCATGVILLRKYFNMFFILLSQNTKFKEKYIENFILSRFQPRQTDNIVIEELMAIIKKSNNSYSDSIRDFLHYHGQERTIQKGIARIIKNAVNAIKYASGTLTTSGEKY